MKWQSMKNAPRGWTYGKGLPHVQLVDKEGTIYPDCHWASDTSGSEQPAFEGWFYPVYTDQWDFKTQKSVKRVSYYAEVRNPVMWALRPEDDPQLDMFE